MDLSALNLLADVVGFGFDSDTTTTTTAWSKSSWDDFAVQVLMEMRVSTKKGLLLSDLEKGLWVPKRKRSKLSNKKKTDLLPFCVPKKKRTTIRMKRKRSGDHDDQIQRPKRQKTTATAHDLGSIKTNPLWSSQRKSQFRFCLVKIHQSAARTTMVS